jgi:hypothetical protein
VAGGERRARWHRHPREQCGDDVFGFELDTPAIANVSLETVWNHEVSLVGLSFVNNFLFFAPPLAWNLAFQGIPNDYFTGSSPQWVLIGQEFFRSAAMAYSLFLPGLAVY